MAPSAIRRLTARALARMRNRSAGERPLLHIVNATLKNRRERCKNQVSFSATSKGSGGFGELWPTLLSFAATLPGAPLEKTLETEREVDPLGTTDFRSAEAAGHALACTHPRDPLRGAHSRVGGARK